jgi:hypothetical protein
VTRLSILKWLPNERFRGKATWRLHGKPKKNEPKITPFGTAGVSSLSLAIGKTLHMLPFLYRSFNMNSFDKHENIFFKVKLKWRRVKKESGLLG